MRVRIIVLAPWVLNLRNVVTSGLVHRLREADAEVDLVTPYNAESWNVLSAHLGEEIRLHRMITRDQLAIISRARGDSLLEELVTFTFARSRGLRTPVLFQGWRNRRASVARRLKTQFVRVMSYWLALMGPEAYRALWRLRESRLTRALQLREVYEQLRRIQPSVIWSTCFTASDEWAYIKVGKQLGIPIVSFVHSFDNLSSQAKYIEPFDYYLVWGPRMKRELTTLYDTLDEKVSITGTPQFDFHVREEFHYSRNQTLKILGLPSDARYVLYGGSAPAWGDDEPVLVKNMVARMQEVTEVRDHWIVIRPHPSDSWHRWSALNGEYKVKVMRPYVRGRSHFFAGVIDSEEERLFVSVLKHARACVCSASTIAIDACVLDKPAIGVDVRREADAPRDFLYDAYYSDHYRPLVDLGGIRIATSWEKLIGLLKDASVHDIEWRKARRRVVEEICGPVDGRAAERLAESLLNAVWLSRRRKVGHGDGCFR